MTIDKAPGPGRERFPPAPPADDPRGPGDDRYALILDRWREIYGPEQWPVSVVGRTPREARVGQHDGHNPALLPTDRYGGERIETVTVLNVRTGERERAGIYRLWRRADG